MTFARSCPLPLALALALICVAVSPAAEPVEARALPIHCADLLDGDCDIPWLCIVLCYMELREQTEYCTLYPTDPRCI